MDDKRKASALTRRGFMRGAAIGSAGAVTLVVGAESAEATTTPSQDRSGRYTETDHIRSYYRSARM